MKWLNYIISLCGECFLNQMCLKPVLYQSKGMKHTSPVSLCITIPPFSNMKCRAGRGMEEEEEELSRRSGQEAGMKEEEESCRNKETVRAESVA